MISRLPLLGLTGALTLSPPPASASARTVRSVRSDGRTVTLDDGSIHRSEADGRYPLVGFSAACLGFVGLVLLVVWIMGGFEDVHLSLAGWIAYGLGVVLTSTLGVGLMALVFYSDRSGRDESAGELRPETDRRA
jgi:hypothetical protein